MKIISIAALALVVAGCAASPQDLAQMSFPPAPPSIDILKVQTALTPLFRDPYGAQIQPGPAFRAYMKEPLIRGGGIAWAGWAIDANINAKNGFGAYTGFRPYHVMLQPDGSVFMVLEASPVEPLFFHAP